jgi:hypothetical protein
MSEVTLAAALSLGKPSSETLKLWIAVAGIVVGVLSAVYTVGGRGALMRREIKQEAEIAALLPEGSPDRTDLEAQVASRLAVYQARLVPYSRGERWPLVIGNGVTAGGFLGLAWGLYTGSSHTSGLKHDLLLGAAVIAVLAGAIALGAMFGVGWRDIVLWNQRRVQEVATERLALGEQPFGMESDQRADFRPDDDHDWLSLRDVAELVGFTWPRVMWRIRRGKLQATKNGGRYWVRRDHLQRVEAARIAKRAGRR